MSKPIFLIKTIMEKEDYKKFLYMATFRKNKFVIPLVLLISLIGSLIVNLDNDYFNLFTLVINWAFMFALAIGVLCFKVERKNKQRLSTDKTGTFGSETFLKFYNDKVVIENKSLNSTGELQYEQFFQLLESKDYFIFYLNIDQASLVRKKDIENIKEFKNFIIQKFENRYKSIYHAK